MKKINKYDSQMSQRRHIDFVNNIKENLNNCDEELTLPEIAENAGIPFSTLKNILYDNSTDCKL